MRLEYNEEQEKELRITEIEAILENELYEDQEEEHCLELDLFRCVENGKLYVPCEHELFEFI